MSDLFEGYRFGRAWDEMFSGPGTPRSSHADVHRSLQAIGARELGLRSDSLARSFLAQGVTFALDDVERPIPIDPIPRIVTTQE